MTGDCEGSGVKIDPAAISPLAKDGGFHEGSGEVAESVGVGGW